MIFRKPKKSLHDLYPQYEIGKYTYGKPDIHDWGEGANLKIGAFTSFADGVQIFLGGEHRTDWVTTFPFNIFWNEAKNISGHPMTKGDVSIGNDVWIATEAVIMSGVTIGDGAVIGARAVVTKNVSAYTIVAGNPAIKVNQRFDSETIEKLLKIKWWHWSDEKIKKALPLLLNSEIDNFLKLSEKF